MYSFETKVRVRYAETDQMGYVYHSNYLDYYEVARTEALRSLNLPYKLLEAEGCMLPVLEVRTKFIKPGRYDDLLTIKVILKEKPNIRIKFEYEVYKENGDLINIGFSTLVFVDMKTAKPIIAPLKVQEVFDVFFDR